MKNMIASAALLLLLQAVLFSCGEETAETLPVAENGTEKPNSTETDAVMEDTYADHLPAELDFGGEAVRLTYAGFDFYKNNDAIGDTNITGDIVKDAVFNRNRAVEERLNVTLDWIEGAADWQGFPQSVEQSVLANDYLYDLSLMQPNPALRIAMLGGTRDMKDLPYTEYDRPYWHTALMEDFNYCGRYDLVCGANLITALSSTCCIIFNKNLYADHFESVDALYDLVEDGKWTLDRMTALCKDVYTDLDGNGHSDLTDILGFDTLNWGVGNLASSCGVRFTTVDADKRESISLGTEQVVSLIDKLYTIVYDTGNAHSPNGYVTADVTEAQNAFASGNRLFYVHSLESMSLPQFRAMRDAYGCLPNPVFEEGMEYCGYTGGSAMVMPTTVPDTQLEIVGAVLEALASESNRSVLPAWYSTSLKDKFADNKRDVDMIQLIYDHLTSDKFIQLNGGWFNDIVQIKGINGGNFLSHYEENRVALEQALAERYAAFAALEE